MKIKNSTVTFWFHKQSNIYKYVDTLNKILKTHFFEFNIIDVPDNIEPSIPRLNTISISNHSNIDISLINAKLNINFDANYDNDSNLCMSYLKEKILSVYESLNDCAIPIVYVAIFINLEQKEKDAVEMINKKFLKNEKFKNLNEVGIRFSQKINNKFYENISLNNSKQVKLEKITESNTAEIIIPLISLNEASEIDEYLSISLEINDKYAFNLDCGHNTTKEDLLEMLNLIKEQVDEQIKKFEIMDNN